MSFLNSEQLNLLTGTFQKHFDQFSTGIGNEILIYKEPIKIINTIGSTNFPGYGEDSSSNTEITYQVVSGAYPCIPIYGNMGGKGFTELHFSLGQNEIMVKVKEDAKNYILDGKTERVIVNGMNYNITSNYKIQNFYGSLYYYFKCTETQ